MVSVGSVRNELKLELFPQKILGDTSEFKVMFHVTDMGKMASGIPMLNPVRE
jgi:hypothetical protein